MEDAVVHTANESLAVSVGRACTNGEGRVALLIAGFTSRRTGDVNRRLAEYLEESGICPVLLDLSGHGDSSGSIADQTILKASDEIRGVIEFIRHQGWCDPNRVAICASSFSGAASVIYAASDPILRCLALKSPIMEYVEMRTRLLGPERIAEWRMQGQIELPDGTPSKYGFMKAAEVTNLYALIARVKCPVMVVQGSNDEEVSPDQYERLRHILNDQKDRMSIIEGADHGYSSPAHKGAVIAGMHEFIVRNL
jgi:pimeloyl-ACP methyl ester carboxylesterase